MPPGVAFREEKSDAVFDYASSYGTRRFTAIGSGMGAPGAVSRFFATQFSVPSANYQAAGTHALAVREYVATETDNKIAARQGGGRP